MQQRPDRERLPPGSGPREAALAPPEAAPAIQGPGPRRAPTKNRARASARTARAAPGGDGRTKPINRTREAPRAAREPNETHKTTQACSGHGTCGTFDECICYPNWQEADCSGRTCPFVPAHVDTPKGDLDGSADALSGTGTTVIAGSTVYPHGTTEQYPLMVDSAGGSLTNTGHAYAECGNKGICDRKSGECDCFPGYSGAGCQKAACGDATCSGHGVCMSAQDLAAADHGNVYNLWDSEVTMGCKCEPGYSGPTCESKMCKHGLDPLYIDDDYMTIRAPTARVLLQYVNVTGNLEAMDELGNADADGDLSTGLSITGTYAIKFYDAFGEDYQTDPLAATADCTAITAALESMANDIVPAGSVICTEIAAGAGVDVNSRNKVEYDLVFTENLGDLKPIEINANLDGTRPSVYAIGHQGADNKVKFDVDVKVLANAEGISGENIDYFPTMCDGVTFQAEAGKKGEVSVGGVGVPTAGSLTAAEEKLLKACLGDADGDASNNLEVYNWDYGTANTTFHPHIVKIVKTPTAREDASGVADDYDAGKYYLAYYGTPGTSNEPAQFMFAGLPPTGADLSIFTTDGTATLLGNASTAVGAGGGGDSTDHEPRNQALTARFAKYGTTVYTSTDVSCDTANAGGKKGHLNACLDKGDKVFLFDAPVGPDSTKAALESATAFTADTGNMYTVVKVGTAAPSASTPTTEDRYYFVVDKAINWDGSATLARKDFGIGGGPTGWTLGPISQGQFDGMAAPGDQAIGTVPVVKFSPGATSYEFVQQCSGRGLCNGDDGLCECFTGYTSDNCDQQSALAV